MSNINRSDIFDKNLNFLLGSGASYGLLPTLAVKLKKKDAGKSHTLETLATQFEGNRKIKTLIFSWYVKEVIKPASDFQIGDYSSLNAIQWEVLENYERFLKTVLALTAKKREQNRANIFTTNYDGLIAHVSERMLRHGYADFILNDGGSGFIKRNMYAKNFNRFFRDQGVFDRHSKSIPQVNLLQLHGSVYWFKDGSDNIEISYDLARAQARMSEVPCIENELFDAVLNDGEKSDADIESLDVNIPDAQIDEFWKQYEQLPIVNPTKWKFHETVFEEHYYQTLRLLSYELEKPNSVFVVFGFSFADEHILNLVKRSLSNPTLKMFVCCFNNKEKSSLQQKFEGFDNVELICVDGDLDFRAFNEQVFTVEARSDEAGS
ncbi:hypothetical protein NXT3_CH03595 [Sinorhizobium fredii]|uniref:Uncharacterized protein n=1 Tax=Rhizobium fredii TaxID=380 RepID=A0A2L0H9E2_RHIFR|nr:hypothetical protein NXT3_CH03595 [Sinorhizobium fredii]